MSIMENLPAPPVSDNDEENLRLASKLAAVNLLFAQRSLAKRICDPTITTKGLLDIAEHSYKVSGMQKKVEKQDDSGRFVFNIHLGDDRDIRIEKVLDGEAVEEPLEVEASKLVWNTRPFPACPEFSESMAAT